MEIFNIIAPVHNLNLKESIKDFLLPGFTLHVRGADVYNEFFGNPKFKEIHGAKYVKEILESPFIFYSGAKNELGKIVNYTDSESLLSYLDDLYSTFFNMLWLVKDNSFTYKNIYLYSSKSGTCSLTPAVLKSTRIGDFESMALTPEEVGSAEDLFEVYANLKGVKGEPIPYKEEDFVFQKADVPLEDKLIATDQTSHNLGRIARSLTFLDSARATSYLSAKIAYYVVMLECLLSFDENLELGHKISQRVAVFIGKDNAEKRIIMKNVKDAYDVRSKYFHGDELKGYDSKKLSNLSSVIDQYSRNVLTGVLNDTDLFNSDKTKLGNHFIDLLFPIKKQE